MGSITYDFLANSILFNDSEIEKQYSSLNDNQLENILQDYRKHCLTNFDDLKKEVAENQSTLKVLSGIEEIPFETLKQSALYFDQFIIYDPLFQFTHTENETSKVVTKYLNFEKNGINRKGLALAAKLLKSITPMIAADFVKILPISYNFEPPKETLINLPINYYADILPEDIMQYFKEKVIVQSMKQDTKGWKILDKQDFTPGLFITFEELHSHKGSIFHFFYQEFVKSENSNKLTLAEYPVDKETWDVWVSQSVHSSAKAVFDKIYIENLIANDLNATYLAENTFTSNLLTLSLNMKETVENSSASQFMNLELPFLDNINIDKLMTIRTHEADLFTNFRIELERQLRELRTINDPKEIKLRQENIIHELGTVQVRKIDQKLNSLKRKGFADGILLLGGLAGTVQTAGWSLLASALASVSGYKTYRDYKDNLTENPSYLLWKVLK
jgi:hypothetical protein